MKKLFLFVAVAAICFSCGNKQEAADETLVDSTAVETAVETVVEEQPVAEQPVVAEKQEAPAQKPAATPAKETVKENAEKTLADVANKAIDKAGEVATQEIENSDKQLQTKKRR